MRLNIGTSILLMSLAANAGPEPATAGDRSEKAAPPSTSCTRAITKAIDTLFAAGAQRMETAPPEMKAKMRDTAAKLEGVIANRCTADKWSAEVIGCYAKAEKREDLRTCRGKLPPDEAQALQAEESQVMLESGFEAQPAESLVADGDYSFAGPVRSQPVAPGSCKSSAKALKTMQNAHAYVNHADGIAKASLSIGDSRVEPTVREESKDNFIADGDAASMFIVGGELGIISWKRDADGNPVCGDRFFGRTKRADVKMTAKATSNAVDGKLVVLTKIKDELCACREKGCADSTHEKYVTWKKSNSKDDQLSDDQMKRFETLRGDLNACWHKFDADATNPASTNSQP